jgi:putative oxidoreductase
MTIDGLIRPVARVLDTLAHIPASLPQLLLRITVAIPFWQSGLTKWDGFLQLSPGASWLFANEFRLHLFGGQYAYPWPTATAFMAGTAEIVLPLLLVLGLGTRFAALGLLLMTAIIQLTVPDGWLTYHLPWAAMLLATLVWGPGRISVDQVIARHLGQRWSTTA